MESINCGRRGRRCYRDIGSDYRGIGRGYPHDRTCYRGRSGYRGNYNY